jgi:lysophospholipase L1-like esterase
MNRILSTSIWLGSIGSLALLSACSSSDAPSGQNQNQDGTGASTSTGGGTYSSTGGDTSSSGGDTSSSGGDTSSTGGALGSGGDSSSSGGDTSSTGGETSSTGGAFGNGGETSGSGGGENASGGSPASGGSTGSGTAKPPCISNPSEVVFIGDSYVTGFLSPALQPSLASLYPAATSYRNYAVAGTSMATGGATGLIPPQLPEAVAAGKDIKLSIMDGGGNDILICDATKFPNCATLCSSAGSSKNSECTSIVKQALDAATTLMTNAANDGIKDVIYFFYPHIPDKAGGYSEILDYAEPIAKKLCDDAFTTTGGKLTCHFVSTEAAFKAAGGDENPANFSAVDGIHPSQAGQDIIAKQIYATMQSDCLGQTSGCCAP